LLNVNHKHWKIKWANFWTVYVNNHSHWDCTNQFLPDVGRLKRQPERVFNSFFLVISNKTIVSALVVTAHPPAHPPPATALS